MNKIKPGAKISGVNFDMKSGLAETVLNLYLKLLVWTEDGTIEEVRSMHINYSFKGSFSADHF